jgi:hydroxylamine dehydrogenase
MDSKRNFFQTFRLLFIGVIVTTLIVGLALILLTFSRAGKPLDTSQVNALKNSTDDCVTCHADVSPDIVQQFGYSTMAAADVTCRDCHEVSANYPAATSHEGTYVLSVPTTALCNQCHEEEVSEYTQSRHGLPAYVAVFGTENLSAGLMNLYQSIPEGGYAPDKSRNDIAALEGPDLTTFTCESCHNIGRPAADESVGQCVKCHLRHQFSLEQARKPETCNACHIGPDHPQWEIYHESAHGIIYETMGENWNWTAEAGTLSVVDFQAATCAICHMSGFGAAETTHDVGDRLTWYLFAPVSERRPDWESNLQRMQSVCLECHNSNFVSTLYDAADVATEKVNQWVKNSQDIIAPLNAANLLTSQPFDEPIDFTYFEIWHHWGRTTKFGVWMQGADYSQWHGAYEMLHSSAELQDMVNQKLSEAGAQQ